MKWRSLKWQSLLTKCRLQNAKRQTFNFVHCLDNQHLRVFLMSKLLNSGPCMSRIVPSRQNHFISVTNLPYVSVKQKV